MAEQSKIQWTDATWNPWQGCIKVGEGCKACYMYRDFERWKKNPREVVRSKTRFNDPLKWKEPRMIFTCSLSDFFIEEADAWRPEAWEIIRKTPQHFYQILTKRPERIEKYLPEKEEDQFSYPYAPRNCIFILSVSTQKEFYSAWPIMESFARVWHARVGLSLEPLLEPIDLTDWMDETDVGDEDRGPVWTVPPHWVIVGGESGYQKGKYKCRPCSKDWIESIIEQCLEHHTPVFVKQLGSDWARRFKLKHKHGGDMNEWPEHLRVRQYPDFIQRHVSLSR